MNQPEFYDVGKVRAHAGNESWLYLEYHGELLDLIEVFERYNGKLVSVTIRERVIGESHE